MKNTKLNLRQMLDELETEQSSVEHRRPTMDDVISANMSWNPEDIIHYLHTEKDPRRLARWCRLYLDLDY